MDEGLEKVHPANVIQAEVKDDLGLHLVIFEAHKVTDVVEPVCNSVLASWVSPQGHDIVAIALVLGLRRGGARGRVNDLGTARSQRVGSILLLLGLALLGLGGARLLGSSVRIARL